MSGTVTNWVKVQYNQARYGRSNGYPCAGNVCTNTWALVRDAANKWYADQIAAGRSEADVNAELATFDQWDRFDYNHDGNFNEPDGYIDHFQIVHAGGDQADGDPVYGEDAIWSHRWATFQGTPPVPPSTRTAATRSATAASGSATTRSSRRTAAGACSSTSTATTSACPTTTTSCPAATTTTSTGP